MKKTDKPQTETPKLALSKKQLEELAEIERRVIAVKCTVSDVTEQILALQNRRIELYGQVDASKAEYLAKLKKFVALLGLDPEDQSLSHDVDLQTGVVTTKAVEKA